MAFERGAPKAARPLNFTLDFLGATGMNKKSELSRLTNIGPTIEERLNEIGVYTRSDLERIGPAKAYQWICIVDPNFQTIN